MGPQPTRGLRVSPAARFASITRLLTLGRLSRMCLHVERITTMSVSAVGSTPPIQPPPQQTATKKNDGDNDDTGGGASTTPVRATPAPGTGTLVDKLA